MIRIILCPKDTVPASLVTNKTWIALQDELLWELALQDELFWELASFTGRAALGAG